MSVAVYNHYRRILSGNDEVPEGEEEVEIARATSCSLAPPVPARRCLRRRLPASLRCPSPSPTPPPSPRPAMWARTWRTSCSSSSPRPTATSPAPSLALSTSMRSTRLRVRPRTSQLRATSPARACSRRFSRSSRAPRRASPAGRTQAPPAGAHPHRHHQHPVHLRWCLRGPRQDCCRPHWKEGRGLQRRACRPDPVERRATWSRSSPRTCTSLA